MANDTVRHTWDQLEPQFRDSWEARYADTGVHWGEIREAHRFGWMMARRPEFAKLCWKDAEPDLRSHWFRPQLTSDDSDWEIARTAAQEGWEKSRQSLNIRQC